MKKYTQIDQETGEEIGSFIAVIRAKQKSPFGDHITMNQAALLTAANTLNHDQTRVLLALLAVLEYENYLGVAQADIADALHMQRPNVSRAIKALLTEGILFEGSKIGRTRTYRLNPNWGWKGSVNNHTKALKHGFKVIEGGKA